MTETLQSPLDVQSFSTPPTTPKGDLDSQKPSLSRRGTGIRPQSLSLTDSAEQWRPPLVVDETNSPELSKTAHNATERVEKLSNGNGNGSMQSNAAYVAPNDSPQSVQVDNYSAQGHLSLKSPCFVHFGLDKAASLTDWLRNSKIAPKSAGLAAPRKLDSGQSESRQLQPSLEDKISSLNGIAAKMAAPSYDEDSEDDGAGSLTRQLAETAVGVREMSKQLGRARVRSNIQNVLVITKARDNRLIKLTRELALYLMLKPRENGRGLVVYVDAQLRHSKRFDAAGIQRDHPDLFRPFMPKRRASSNTSSNLSISALREKLDLNGRPLADEGQLRYWTSDMCTSSPHLFDFVVTLGGDGTVLFTSWLFQRIVPPVLPFALGSLGFLTNFDFADHQTVMESAIESGIRVNLRMRFTCTVYRAVAPEEGKGRKAVKKGETGEILMKNLGKGGWEALEGGYSGVNHNPCKDKEIMCYTTRAAESFEILNDLVVDRGPSPYVSLLELFGDEHHMTTVQADGLTISTPTGSTAYSLSAGGSLVHPEIPALLITPICPHTLSFRPMLLPDTMELRVCVPYNSRSTAWASFDGRGRVELKQGDHIKVTASKYPFPTVCADKQSTDWFNSISRTLKWNERERQKSFVVVEEGHSETTRKGTKQPSTDVSGAEGALGEADEEDEEEEEKFDIDDSSPEANSSSASASSEPSPKTAATAMIKGLPNLDAHVYSSKLGTDSPDRFHGRPPQPPKLSPRHAQKTQAPEQEVRAGEQGDRDNIHSPRAAHQSGRSRIPRDRDLDGENVLTPRAFEQATRRPSGEGARRAFAVWGHDESDSNTSDSESG